MPNALVVRRTGAILCPRVESAQTSLTRLFGLMFRAEFAAGSGLWIEPCNSIHMMFVFFPIDVLWLDSTNVVLKVSSRVPSWYGLAVCFQARVALELPAGTAAGVLVGDKLDWA